MDQMKPSSSNGEVSNCRMPTMTVSLRHSVARKAAMMVPTPGVNTLMRRRVRAAGREIPLGMPIYT